MIIKILATVIFVTVITITPCFSAEELPQVCIDAENTQSLTSTISLLSQCLDQVEDSSRASDIYSDRGFAWINLGNFEKAQKDLLQAIASNDANHMAYNRLAWLYATFEDNSRRNGNEAVRLSLIALSLEQIPSYYDTLAAGYAQLGDFAKAVESELLALELAKNLGRPQSSMDYYQWYIERYESSKPFAPYRQ
ncbi:tetratricopeptide repeat protein [Desulfoplanes sp.]